MLSEHNKYEVRKIISEVLEISAQSVMDGDTFKTSYEATKGEFEYLLEETEDVFDIQMGDCKDINTVSDLYEHLDKLID